MSPSWKAVCLILFIAAIVVWWCLEDDTPPLA